MNSKNLHVFPLWWGLMLLLVSTLLMVLPLKGITQFINNGSDIGTMVFVVAQLIISFIVFAWGVDVIYYRDKNIKNYE